MIETRITSLFTAYSNERDQFLESLKKWENDKSYSADYISQRVRELKQQMQETDAKYNADLQKVLTGEIDRIEKFSTNKEDFQVRLSNALSYINLMGGNLSDEAAFSYVQPFFGDYKTMNNLYPILSSRYSSGGLDVTLQAVGGYTRLINKLKAMNDSYKSVFSIGTHTASSLSSAIMQATFMGDVKVFDSSLESLYAIHRAANYYDASQISNKLTVSQLGTLTNA